MSSRICAVLLVLAVLLNAFLSYRLVEERVRVITTGESVQALQLDLQRATSATAALQAAIGRIDLRHTSLSGLDYATAREYLVDSLADGVYYFFAPDCSACAINLLFLSQLATEFPHRVVAIALREEDQLADYVEEHGIEFPVLGSPEGLIVQLVPRNVVPVTVMLVDGHVQPSIVGRIEARARRTIRSVLRRSTSLIQSQGGV